MPQRLHAEGVRKPVKKYYCSLMHCDSYLR